MAKPFKRIILLSLVIVVSIFVIALGTVNWFGEKNSVPLKADAVIVLGAKVGTPALTNRALLGYRYFEEGRVSTIVLSGGQGANEPVSEAQAMKTVLDQEAAKLSSSPPNLLLETNSSNTVQNITNSKTLIPQAASVVIVSDCFHLARAVLIAKDAGFQNVYRDCPSPSYYSRRDLIFYYLRETLALTAYFPTYLFNRLR